MIENFVGATLGSPVRAIPNDHKLHDLLGSTSLVELWIH